MRQSYSSLYTRLAALARASANMSMSRSMASTTGPPEPLKTLNPKGAADSAVQAYGRCVHTKCTARTKDSKKASSNWRLSSGEQRHLK
jgi:hypothetical protein